MTQIAPFQPPANDPLAPQHALIQAWTDETLRTFNPAAYQKEPDLQDNPAGQAIGKAKPAEARKIVAAAAAQLAHWDRVMKDNPNIDHTQFWGRRFLAAIPLNTLMRRALPYEQDDLIALMQWCSLQDKLSVYRQPISPLVKAIQKHVQNNPITPELRAALAQFARKLRSSHEKDCQRHGTTIEQLIPAAPEQSPPSESCAAQPAEPPRSPLRPLTPGPAGNPNVLCLLKHRWKLAEPVEAEQRITGPDRFPLPADSPLAPEHEVLSQWFTAVGDDTNDPKLTRVPGALRNADPSAAGRFFLAAAERAVAASLGVSQYIESEFDAAGAVVPGNFNAIQAAMNGVNSVGTLDMTFDRDTAFDALLFIASRAIQYQARFAGLRLKLLEQVKQFADASPLTEGERWVLYLLRAALLGAPPLGTVPDEAAQVTPLIADAPTLFLIPGEVWADAVNADLSPLSATEQKNWIALLRHLLTATAARPAGTWISAALKLADAIGRETVLARTREWLAKFPQGRSFLLIPDFQGDLRRELMHEDHATLLRGLIWLAPELDPSADMARLISTVAAFAYKKLPGVGPRAVKVGNASIYALSNIGTADAVGQLAVLKVRVKFGTAQKEIEKAFNVAAESLGLPRDEIEELGIPTYGLEDVGLRRETLGEATAEIRVEGRDVSLNWFNADGKSLKSVPAKVKADFKDDLKDIQTAVKDLAAMLPAQSERLDSLFLLQKSWPVEQWRERYLNHPLLGTLARRLIWTWKEGDRSRTAIHHDGKIVNADNEPLDPPPDARISLWHPIGQPMDDVLAWRAFLEKHEIRQPFKQAHREIYVLTDAERRTATYSNRFAAHVLRQHQFNALCSARGWKNKLRMMVDDTYPPATRELPQWNLRAEFWIEGIGDNFGADTTESGAFHHIATDQVRFYRTGAAENLAHAHGGGYTTQAHGQGNLNDPIPLDQVPPLVFSEIMRDVDLFVGVSSVGNDPTWQDGGPGGRFLNYWQSYSFGDLSEGAQTRRAVLETLLPRLTKLKGKLTLSDKFLIVKGHLHTYKIHLGSGNILMEPNDQYLCIVLDGSALRKDQEVFLPFEGDVTLSLILSKAFLLADDSNIKDPTITRQITR